MYVKHLAQKSEARQSSLAFILISIFISLVFILISNSKNSFADEVIQDQPVITDFKTEALTDLNYAFQYQFKKYTMVHELYLQMDQTGEAPEAFQGLMPSLLDDAKVEMPELEKYVATLEADYQNCLANLNPSPEVCPIPAAPITPQFDFLYAILIHQGSSL
jgi:hypothetical protein